MKLFALSYEHLPGHLTLRAPICGECVTEFYRRNDDRLLERHKPQIERYTGDTTECKYNWHKKRQEPSQCTE